MSNPSPKSSDQTNGRTKAKRPAKYKTHKQPGERILISISKGLLDMVDKAAKEDFTTRSDIIRMAILWYLRPQGRDLDQADPDVILKTLQHRKARLAIKELLKELEEPEDEEVEKFDD